jgi:hypothetical protein
MIFEDVRKSLSYAGTEFAPPVDESFTLGSLSFANWGVPEGHELAYSFDNVVTSFEFEIVMSFDNVSELDFTYHVEMNVIGNSISYTLDGITYTFTVKEGTSASTDVIGKLVPKLDAYIVETVNGVDTVGWKIVGYDLLLLGFANPTAGGYVTSSIPEASSWLMFLFGLAVIGLVKGNRRTILSVA